MPTPLPRHELLKDLFIAFRSFKTLTRDELARHDLTPTHIVALRFLKEQGRMSMSRLTEMLDVTHGASTGVVDRLCKLGMVVREHSPHDRRVVEVALTPEGDALFHRVNDAVASRLEEVLAGLEPELLSQIVQGLRLLAEAFGAHQASPDCEDPHAATR